MDEQSWASSPAVRKSMQGNRRRDTAPELAVRRLVHAAGLRYRVDQRPLPAVNRKADLVFRRAQVVVFIDGCFWHRCPNHFHAPALNREFWAEKIEANVARDRETDRVLRDAGWTVLRFWEHEEPQAVAETIERFVRATPPTPGRV